MPWERGQGLLGPLNPLVGDWVVSAAEGNSAAAGMWCTRTFSPLGKDWLELHAVWRSGPKEEYRERALFGAGDDGGLSCYSFTSDGRKSVGHFTDALEVDPRAISFEAEMPAGLARMLYWPLESGSPGFNFAAESKTLNGWSRFLHQRFTSIRKA